jgi:hypothetical protein
MQLGSAERWWNLDGSNDLYPRASTSFSSELLLNRRQMKAFI